MIKGLCILVSSVSCIFYGDDSANWLPPSTQHSDLVRASLIEGDVRQIRLLIDMAAGIAPDGEGLEQVVEAYLDHPNMQVKKRAMSAMSGIERIRRAGWVPQTGAHADFLYLALVLPGERRSELFDEMVSLGPEVAEDIKAYLTHPHRRVRERAIFALSRIPEVAEDTLIQCLSSKDETMRGWALYYARPLLSKPKLADAWVDCLLGPFPSTNYRSLGYTYFFQLDPPIRANMIPRLIGGGVALLEEGDAPTTSTIAKLLGRIAEPGDERVLNALAGLRNAIDERAETVWASKEPNVTNQNVAKVRRALLFAEANLGRRGAFAEYASIVQENPDMTVRLDYLELLPYFRQNRDVLALVLQLLDDETELRRMQMSEGPPLGMQRTCDVAGSVLYGWHHAEIPVYPGPVHPKSKIFEDKHLDVMRTWLSSYVDSMGDEQPARSK